MGQVGAGVEITKDGKGIGQAILRNQRGASAKVSLEGGQVVSWKNVYGEELLFTSRKAIFPNKLRGGIQICFPQFGDCGALERHGFARNRLWTFDQTPPSKQSNAQPFVDLLLTSSPDDLNRWPHSLRVALSANGNLTLTSRIRNAQTKPFTFSFAYHTYLSVSDISEVRIEGLETLDYLDNLRGRRRFTEQGDSLTFESEVDRVYLSSPQVIAVIDHERKRTCVIRNEGLPDAAVWNPWEKKRKSTADLGDDEYKRMVCVDGAVIETPITLKQREQWVSRVQLSVEHSSFYYALH